MRLVNLAFFIVVLLSFQQLKAQYVQPERDDTIRLFAKTPFDTAQARRQLARGTATIKGVAFTRPNKNTALGFKTGKLLANKMKIVLMPVTPYLTEFLELKKKENPKKLKYAYMSPQAWYFRLEAITNSDGEFTFPEMKPGKYYLEAVLNWSQDYTYNKYSGSAYNGYGTTNYYTPTSYTVNHADLLTKFVEVKKDGEIVEIKLK